MTPHGSVHEEGLSMGRTGRSNRSLEVLSAAFARGLYQAPRRPPNDKGLPKKASAVDTNKWLPDLDSNQGPAD